MSRFRACVKKTSGLIHGPVKVPALPHGRATQLAEAQVSSPRVSKGCAWAVPQRNDLRDFDGAL